MFITPVGAATTLRHCENNEVIPIYIATYFVASALENVVSGKWCRIQKVELLQSVRIHLKIICTNFVEDWKSVEKIKAKKLTNSKSIQKCRMAFKIVNHNIPQDSRNIRSGQVMLNLYKLTGKFYVF